MSGLVPFWCPSNASSTLAMVGTAREGVVSASIDDRIAVVCGLLGACRDYRDDSIPGGIDHERDVGERQRRHIFLSSCSILFDGTTSAGEMDGRGRRHLISSPRCCGAGLPHHFCCARLWRRRGCALCNVGRHRKHCNVHVRDGAGGCVLGVGCSNSFLGVEMKSR